MTEPKMTSFLAQSTMTEPVTSAMTTSETVSALALQVINCSNGLNTTLLVSCVSELVRDVTSSTSTLNSTLSSCVTESSDLASTWDIGEIFAVLIAILLSAVIVGTLLGNASVILAVSVYDKMRTLSNMLIASLGLADLLVAIVVMPISLQVCPSLRYSYFYTFDFVIQNVTKTLHSFKRNNILKTNKFAMIMMMVAMIMIMMVMMLILSLIHI